MAHGCASVFSAYSTTHFISQFTAYKRTYGRCCCYDANSLQGAISWSHFAANQCSWPTEQEPNDGNSHCRSIKGAFCAPHCCAYGPCSSVSPTVTPGSPTKAPTSRTPTTAVPTSPTTMAPTTAPPEVISCSSDECYCGSAARCTCEGSVLDCHCENAAVCECKSGTLLCNGHNADYVSVALGVAVLCGQARVCDVAQTTVPATPVPRDGVSSGVVVGVVIAVLLVGVIVVLLIMWFMLRKSMVRQVTSHGAEEI